MRYEEMGRARRQRLNIPQLLGGVNTATQAEFIDDDELAEACNLRIDHGTLRTREAVRAVGDEGIDVQEGQHLLADAVVRHPIEVNGELCTMLLSSRSNSTQNGTVSIRIVNLDGQCVDAYTMEMATGSYNIAVAPCDTEMHSGGFLLYSAKGLCVPNTTDNTVEPLSEDNIYVPLVMINGTSIPMEENTAASYTMANGVMYEGYNVLTGRYRAQFTPCGDDAASKKEVYCLPTALADGTTVTMEIVGKYGAKTLEMTVGGEAVGISYGIGTIVAQAFAEGYVKTSPLDATGVSGTVTITCVKEGTHADVLKKVKYPTWFGGTANKRGGTRLFLADAATAKLMWSDVNDPFYFPENNYMLVGDASQNITALEKQSDMLVIFKEREIFYTTYVQGEIDAEAVANGVNADVTVAQAYFPLTQLSPQVGCRCPHSIALCRDRLVWMDEDARIYTLVVSGAYSERNVREIGQKIRPWLLENTTADQRRRASAIDHNGKYRLMVGNVMAEFDYNDSGFVNVSGYSSGERAARNIAWMTHRYTFGDTAVQALISDGADKALIISTDTREIKEGHNSSIMMRTAYTFDGTTATDRYLRTDSSGACTAEECDIPVSLTTKTYEFGDPASYKRLHALYPMLQTDGAELAFITDGEEPRCGRPYRSADTFAHLVLPAVKRCRTFALKIQAVGKLCLKGLRMEYSLFGNVK